MFADTKAFSGFSVGDLEEAQQFYGGTLGLRTSQENGLLILHLAGDRDTLGGGPNIAWFTDPAGNILAVLQEG
ncbi:MAG TPA: hypothetical protein VHU92_05350 [Streptosporangiaceae bacterium]|jgi:predicted enzyme related to lactoylglutathione lyase|nr:hypothetical protein [Streptosporangiaceae bacterium]